MRRILIDQARRQHAVKRGGVRVRVPLTPEIMGTSEDPTDLLDLNDALERLADRSPRMAQIVEFRFFGGMSVAQTAEVLETSVRTVEREWARARAYLYEALSMDAEPQPDPHP